MHIKDRISISFFCQIETAQVVPSLLPIGVSATKCELVLTNLHLECPLFEGKTLIGSQNRQFPR